MNNQPNGVIYVTGIGGLGNQKVPVPVVTYDHQHTVSRVNQPGDMIIVAFYAGQIPIPLALSPTEARKLHNALTNVMSSQLHSKN